MNVSRLKRALVPLFGVLAMMSFSAAQADSFGRSTIGATPSSGLRADFKRGSKYTLTQPGLLRELCAYVDGQASPVRFDGGQYFRIAMYRDSGGVPGARVAEGYQEDVRDGDAARWHCVQTAFAPLTPGDYWIVLHTDRTVAQPPYDSTPVIRYYADGTGNWYGNADTFSDGASAQFGAGGTGDGTLSAYASFVPHSELSNAGRTTVGTTPSGALRANFKRGSSFTLSEEGRVMSISGYFDGLGGGSGAQYVTMAIYKDNGGVPDEYVSSGSVRVDAGMTPRWLTTYYADAVTLPPGKYWLALLTSQQTVARYYADGTGNWYGNADNFADGPSNPFGAGGTGDGTISAFISYEPGPFTQTTVGSQVSGTPQRTLRENYTQGSLIGVLEPNAVVTGVNAYIDGLGGASGSQRVKLVLMNSTQTDYVATEEKIIPAGAPAQWVHFHLPPYRNLETSAGQFWVWISSGGSQGVARIYGRPGTGTEVALIYEPEPYVPPFFFDYPQSQNNVGYSFYMNVQLQDD